MSFDSQDIIMLPTKKTLDSKESRKGGNSSVEKKEIAYNVSVTSKAFHELQNVTIKYNIIYYDAVFGGSGKPEVKTAKGSHTFPSLISNKKVEFETTPIVLTVEKLDANWYFPGGGNRKANDRVAGLWFRAFDAEGKQIGEYANPKAVIAKSTWQE
ncbi:MAG: hypothetical protein Fur0032_16560 [Terrimicrobiaceae bacterium]